MNSKTILGSSPAVGVIVSGVAAVLMVGSLSHKAEANPSSTSPAWSQRCDRNWNSSYCNPKIDKDDNNDDDDRRVDKYGIYRKNGQIYRGGGLSGGGLNGDTWQSTPKNTPDRQNPRVWRGKNDRWDDRWDDRDDDWYREEPWDNRDDWNRGYRVRLAPGTIITTYPERRRRVVLRRSERYPISLVVRQDVGRRDWRGGVVLPRGCRIEGDIMPYRDGYRFVAEEVRFPNGRRQSISAISSPFGTGDYWGRYDRDDVYVSNGAYSILDNILGRSTRSNHGVIGDIFSRYPNSRRDLIAINPGQSIDLRLTREFRLD